VLALRERMLERSDQLFTSSLTLGEVLVKPLEVDNPGLAEQYRQAITAGATIINFDAGAAMAYARIRKDRSIRPPDAIQLACAATAQMELFITNDDRLSQKTIEGIHFIVSLERALI
jgi:predicted nucleic acid-binding protein